MKVEDFSSLSYRFSVRLYRNAKFFHRTAGSDDAFRKCPPPQTQKIPRRAQGARAAGEERNDIKVGKVNVDEQPDLAAQFGVMSIPTLLVFKNGKLVNQTVGARPKSGVLALLDV